MLKTTLEELTPGSLYTYKVKSTNRVGDGPWSAEYSFLIVNEPSQPLNPRVVEFSDNFVEISWEQPLMNGGQALSGFNIYRQDTTLGSGIYSLLVGLTAHDFYYTDSGVDGGHDYQYYITSFNVLGGESVQSLTLYVTPSQAPSGMTAPIEVTHSKNSVTLSWNPPTSDGSSPVRRYIMYAKADF